MIKFVLFVLVGVLVVTVLCESFALELEALFDRLQYGDAYSQDLPGGIVYLPVVVQDRTPRRYMLEAYFELLQHCVEWDELLDCAEYPIAGSLSTNECRIILNLVDYACPVIGAVIQ